ncbi:MAG: cyclase family protein [Nitrospira sp. CR2.1]|nr:cyclase family protein [Nitrospira sp. CR2.1]MBA5873243.1 cyclase family protein [Nitrospira sp. CR1.2]
MTHPWIDISVPLRNGMPHWPDNPPLRINRTMDLNCGDEATVSTLFMGSHTGTHMDAPLHFVKGGRAIHEMSLTATIGPAQVIQIHDPRAITLDELRRHVIRPGARVLFKTRNSLCRWGEQDFMEDFVYLTTEAARWLVQQRVRTVGIDYLSVGGYKRNGPEVHHVLLEAQIWIIEGLDLSAAIPGFYDLICLPLNILQGDGAPARALLRPRDESTADDESVESVETGDLHDS